MRNICIGCGCDEDNACPQLVDGNRLEPCTWLRFSADAHAGVCSCCEDLVKGWDDGGDKPLFTLIAERFYRQAMFLYESRESAMAWMASPQFGIFGGRPPRELILEGRLEEVQTLLAQIRSGAHV